MPSFADNVKPDEAWDLVFYLRTLQPNSLKLDVLRKSKIFVKSFWGMLVWPENGLILNPVRRPVQQ